MHGLEKTLERLASFTATPGEGVTRFSWSATDAAAREWLESELRSLGLEPWTDGAGNLHARLHGTTDGPAVYMGSHLDSVRHGGHLDGAYGVAASLEVLRTLCKEGVKPVRPVEWIAFAEEEGSNCGCTCLGSKAITGVCSVDDLKRIANPQGRSAYALMREAGLNPDALPSQQIDAGAAFLEVHIEQNAVLERAARRLGLVSAICGMRLHRITLGGVSDHAASPMAGRRDPIPGFAEIVLGMEQLTSRKALPEGFSWTVGTAHCVPDMVNVIPQAVNFTIDVRHVAVDALEAGWEHIRKLVASVAESRGLTMDCVHLSSSGGVPMDETLGTLLLAAAEKLGESPLSLPSGPAHDAACMAARMPTALLFVPSRDGLSHCPQEHTDMDALVLGARVLQETVRKLAMQGSVD